MGYFGGWDAKRQSPPLNCDILSLAKEFEAKTGFIMHYFKDDILIYADKKDNCRQGQMSKRKVCEILGLSTA